MFGFLNINKPAGCTSRDVVNRVGRLLPRKVKVGHAGTLDPLATGVLLVAVGPATRLVDHAHRLTKQYRGTFLLGRASESDDIETEVREFADAAIPNRDALDTVLPHFFGSITQVPPSYSAIKIDGREAYKRVRQGESVVMPSREVQIHALGVVAYEYPKLVLDIECGSGTYIRSLGRDIAQRLGTAAVMSDLVRTAVGPFGVDEAATLDDLTTEEIARQLIDPVGVLPGEPLVLSVAQEQEVRNGRFIHHADETDELAAVDARGRLVCILVPRGEGVWGPRLVFPPDDPK